MDRPKLIVVGGSIAMGKTTVSKQLAENTGIKRVSMDEIKETLFDVGGYRGREWSKEIGRLAFPVFMGIIEMYLRQGESVIADSTFLWPEDANWLHEFADLHGADIYQIWMTADPQIARQRFILRAQTERHPGHNDSLDSVIAEFDEKHFSRCFIPLPLRGKTMVIDTSKEEPFDHEAILKFIN
ncbi:ATP-binding protein [Patescibacteria group bacterium]|nr:ATP-binding protein [Patescibacteria group bacterium]